MSEFSSLAHIAARALVLCFLALGAQSTLAASQCDGKEPSKWTADSAREARLCLANLDFTTKECDRALCKDIEAWRPKPRDKKVEEASRLLAAVRDSLAKDVLPGFREAQPLQREIERWLTDMTLATPEDLRSDKQGPYRSESVRSWAYNSTSQIVLESQRNEINLGKIIDEGCTTAGACERVLRGDAEVVIHSSMIQIIAGTLLQDLRQDAATHIDMLDKRWGNYFGASRFQYPWELAINDQRFKTNGRAGFVSPPEDQIIFMHPSAGVRYNAQSATKFDPTLVLELLGMYRWHWEGAEPKELIGGSLIMTWANQAGERSPGWGAMAHFQKSYSVGFTHHASPTGSKTSLLLSVDLAKLFEDKAAVTKKLKGLTE